MDPLSIQMAMGSPPALRSKMSLSSLVGRKKKSPESDRSITPGRRRSLATIDESSLSTPTRSDTVRTRRGFRPLSVLTNSVLSPFEFDTLKAMKELQEEKADQLLDNEAAEATEGKSQDASARTSSAHSVTEASQALTTLPFSNDSEISLRAFLEQSGPSNQTAKPIEAPFSTLYNIPAPDITQHPAFSTNPFTSKSDFPDLVTTSTADEIKKFMSSTRTSSSRFTDRTSSSSDVFGGSDKKKFPFVEKGSSPASPNQRSSAASIEQSPLAKRHPKSCPIEIPYNVPDTPTTEDERKRVPSGSLRKISDILRSKMGSDKLDTPVDSTTEETPMAAKQRMEIYLRKVTCSPTFHYTDSSWLPRHPNTRRMWRSRNLKCTNCVDVSCGCCGRACCAYKAAVMALETHKNNPQGREEALERIQQITMVFPYGQELPTFLQCTTGSGCGKLVCPECCGQCPDEICCDIQCRKCKKNPWAECDWHVDLPQLAKLGGTTGPPKNV